MILTLEVVGPQASTLGTARRKAFGAEGGTLGRLPDNDWVLPDPHVSARHAIIRFTNGQFSIEDISRNGIYINWAKVPIVRGRPHPLNSGDRILIEPYEIEAQVVEEPQPRVPQRPDIPSSEPVDPLDLLELDATRVGPSLAASRPQGRDDAQVTPPPSIPGRTAEDSGAFGPLNPVAPGMSIPGTDRDPESPRSRPTARRAPQPTSEHDSPGKAHEYTVWFGTNRAPLTNGPILVAYSSDRAARVTYGTCTVTIPKGHKIGSLGSPLWKRMITMHDDRLKLTAMLSKSAGRFWRDVASAIRLADPRERDALVFLHGYNVSFEDAALRAAQIGFDLGIQGAMAFYSWPSQGTLDGYPADEASIEASEGFITEFLIDMAERSGASRVHLIAHSMGNRGLLRAVDRIATNASAESMGNRGLLQAVDRIAAKASAESKRPFSQIILAAADVDQDTFKRLSVAYSRVAERTTMYVCSKDRAVEASRWLHDFPRAGLMPR